MRSAAATIRPKSRAVVLAALVAIVLLVRPAGTSGQDIFIPTITVITTETTLPSGAASAEVVEGSGTIDGATAATGSNSLMFLELSGGAGTMLLGSHSSVGFGSPGGAPGPGAPGGGSGGGDGSISVVGQVWMRLQPRTKWEIKTPNAAPSVRGTTFTVEARTGWTRLRTYSGVVEMRNLRGKVRTVSVRRRRETVVRGDRPPTRPKRFALPRRPFWE